MTTKTQFIAEAKAANPKPLYRTENGTPIELTDEEYESSIEAWAEMRVEQEKIAEQSRAKEAAAASGRAKLAALGLTDDEIDALVG
jgi:hypothetical protein